MFRGPWAMGDSYTIANPYLFTIACWMEVDSVDPAAFPRVLDHRDRMVERPAVRRALKAEGLASSRASGDLHIFEIARLTVDADAGRGDPARIVPRLVTWLHQRNDEGHVVFVGQPIAAF